MHSEATVHNGSCTDASGLGNEMLASLVALTLNRNRVLNSARRDDLRVLKMSPSDYSISSRETPLYAVDKLVVFGLEDEDYLTRDRTTRPAVKFGWESGVTEVGVILPLVNHILELKGIEKGIFAQL